MVRKNLFDELNQHYDLQGYCLYVSAKVIEKCKELNVPARLMKIYPGFTIDETFHKKRGVHYFVLVLIHERVFLIDITYSQFFLLKRCLLERIGIPLLSSCRTGVFMLMTDSRRYLAEKLLKDGYILLTEDVFKDYMDGFLLSWRNGLYYEETDDFSYTVPYTILQYYDFLTGKDNQLNHEEPLVLGKQQRPLKNPYLDFSKRI